MKIVILWYNPTIWFVGGNIVSKDEMEKYIEYFNNKDIRFYEYKAGETKDGIFHIGHIYYDEGLEEFMEFFNDSDLVDYNYDSNLEKYIGKVEDLDELIDEADVDLLKSILTYYVRQEHFCEGVWAEAVENRIFVRVLEKLNK